MTDTVAAESGLGASFQGTTIGPQDRDYDAARAIYNGSIDRRPALIVRPHGAADVADAIRFANQRGLQVSVRCGGHGIAGTSVAEGGLLLDLSPLKGVHVDRARGTAVAQGGALWGEYDRALALHGVATPGGRVTTTGVGGFCLGGGYGWLSTLYGLTCDNLVSADVVTAEGRLVRASEVENPDLLWGLRRRRELRRGHGVRAQGARHPAADAQRHDRGAQRRPGARRHQGLPRLRRASARTA